MAGFDTASLRLALELQLQDVEGLAAKPKGRSRKRKASDFDVALGAYQEHLTSEIRAVGGRFPALAPAANEPLPAQPRKRVATGKRKVTAARTRINLPREAKTSSSQAGAVSTQPGAAQTGEETSSSAADTGAAFTDLNGALRCRVCDDAQAGATIFRAPCNDIYCATCLVRHFTGAVAGELKFPPECCSTPITLESGARRLLPADIVRRFERRQLDLSTPNPRYCHNAACAEFLPPADFAGDRARCPSCRDWTCILCRAAAHDGVCPDDPAQNEVSQMALERGWKPCTGCGRLIERIGGCPHMKCRCGAEFCYNCGGRWPDCLPFCRR